MSTQEKIIPKCNMLFFTVYALAMNCGDVKSVYLLSAEGANSHLQAQNR